MVLKSGYVYKKGEEVVRMARYLDDDQQTAEGLEMIGLIDNGEDVLFEPLQAKRSNVDVMDVFNVNWRLI